MLLRHSPGLNTEADVLEAVNRALEGGAQTPVIASLGARTLSTQEMGDVALANLAKRN